MTSTPFEALAGASVPLASSTVSGKRRGTGGCGALPCACPCPHDDEFARALADVAADALLLESLLQAESIEDLLAICEARGAFDAAG